MCSCSGCGCQKKWGAMAPLPLCFRHLYVHVRVYCLHTLMYTCTYILHIRSLYSLSLCDCSPSSCPQALQPHPGGDLWVDQEDNGFGLSQSRWGCVLMQAEDCYAPDDVELSFSPFPFPPSPSESLQVSAHAPIAACHWKSSNSIFMARYMWVHIHVCIWTCMYMYVCVRILIHSWQKYT